MYSDIDVTEKAMAMTDLRAHAIPRKRFFVEMFTRDISLKDCILDLIDNSIDGLVRAQDIDLGESLLKIGSDDKVNGDKPEIKVNFSSRQLSVRDNCGGMSTEEAKNEMFNFGHSLEYYEMAKERSLGVYGVGLKRALFKIGRSFSVISKTTQTGFKVAEDNLEEWIKKDKSLDDWSFDMEITEQARTQKTAGTRIVVKKIRNSVKHLLDDQSFEDELKKDVARVYTFFLNRFVRIKINDKYVDPIEVPIGESEDVTPAIERQEIDNVNVTIIASLAARDQKGQWFADQAGWYIACNGRMVATADRTSLTNKDRL